MPIVLTSTDRDLAVASLVRYFHDELDQPIGNVEVVRLLDYILTDIGPSIYNQAVADAVARLTVRVGDLEAELYQEEFQFWPQSPRRRHSR